MGTFLPAILDRLDDLANELGDEAVREALDAIRELYDAPKLQVLVAGSTGAGRASVVDALLMTPDLIPQSPLPKAPVSLFVRYAPSEIVQTMGTDGTRSALQPSQLRGLLTGEGARGGRYAGVDIRAPFELLTVCDFRIEALDGTARRRRGTTYWRRVMSPCSCSMPAPSSHIRKRTSSETISPADTVCSAWCSCSTRWIAFPRTSMNPSSTSCARFLAPSRVSRR